MSEVSSLADAASSGAGEELSFVQIARGQRDFTLKESSVDKDSGLRHQLFLKATEAKRWQDSVLHLSGIATGKDEALGWERSRNTQLALSLEQAEDAAAALQIELDSAREEKMEEKQAAMQQVAALQSEVQAILGTCSALESHVVRLQNGVSAERDSVHAAQQSHDLATKELGRVRKESAAANERAAWRKEQSRQVALELQAKLYEAGNKLQVVQADREHALRYASSCSLFILACHRVCGL